MSITGGVVAGHGGEGMRGFRVPFSIRTSHQINSVGFSGESTIVLPTPLLQANVKVEPVADLSLEITRTNSEDYMLVVGSQSDFDESNTISVISAIEAHLTFLLNRRNANPHYGTYFVRFALNDLEYLHRGSGVRISETLKIKSEGLYQPHESDWVRVIQSNLVKSYFAGARTSEPKSKYFEWFRIVEALEGSKAYRQRNWALLFNENEQKSLTDVAITFTNRRKVAVVRELLNRTALSRSEKLMEFLRALGITKYEQFAEAHEITAQSLKLLTDARNSLFHAGADFDEALLWRHLFPLVTTIVEVEVANGLPLN